MHQPIPERSMSCPISSSSGTRTASCSRERSAYLLVMNVPADVHLDGVVDVGSPCFGRVTAMALLLSLLASGQQPFESAVDLLAQREPDVVRDEDRNLAQFLPRHLLVVKDRVGLHFHQLFHALGGEHAEQHHPPVAHRQPGAAPDGAEEVIDRECEVLAGHARHLPAVDLVHLLEALLAQFVHDYSFACGTPRPAARFFSATSASGRSTSTASPSASARLRSFSPSPRACRKGWYRK